MVEIRETQPCQKELKIQVPADLMEKELAATYQRVGKQRTVKGFRRGKAPRTVLERIFGEEVRSEALSNRISVAFSEAAKENRLNIIGAPVFSEVKWEKNQPLTFTVTVDVPPEIRLGNYRGIRVSKKKFTIEENEIAEALEVLRERLASYETIAGKALEAGDYALIDYREAMDQSMKWRENQLFPVTDDSNGFSGQLIGMKPGETRTVTVVTSGGGKKDSKAGEELKLLVKLKEIKKKNLPELNDEFASQWGEFSNCDELRTKMKESIIDRKEEEVRGEMEDQIISRLLQKSTFSLPPATLARFEESYFKEFQRHQKTAREGEALMADEKALKEKSRTAAERDLRVKLILEEIARREELKVDPKTLGEEIRRQADRQGINPTEYRRQLEEEKGIEILANRLLQVQVMNFLILEAKIKETSKQEGKL